MEYIIPSVLSKKSNENMRVLLTLAFGLLLGFFAGVSFTATFSFTKFNLPSTFPIPPNGTQINITCSNQAQCSNHTSSKINSTYTASSDQAQHLNATSEIWVASNPRGAERLPPGIVASESDLYLRKLQGLPQNDLTSRPNYLVAFTVGYEQKKNIDAAVKKFSGNFTIVLFHYDGRTSEWDEFEWSKHAIHFSAHKQTKWWYAKRFLHPDIVAPYDYIFIWDEDLGLEHFDAEKYIELVKKHGLEISQPALDPNRGITWPMTKRRADHQVHKESGERSCSGKFKPPCAAFVEIMAPVFSKDAWRCVWHMLQNDLVHGWGLDFALKRCVKRPAHEKIGVVDAQWIVHQSLPTLGNQGVAQNGKNPRNEVRDRCKLEWKMFSDRLENAVKDYANTTRH